MKLHKDRELFTTAIQTTSKELGMAPEFVEKDYWICQILQNLSRHRHCERIVWKGGTSLSKAYGLIKRFSSDVDFAVLLEGLSQNQQKKLVAQIGRDTTSDLKEIDFPMQTVKNNRFRKTYHGYDSVLGRKKEALNFLGNHVIVEINTFGNPYPNVRLETEPFIAGLVRSRGITDMLTEMDMLPFELNVLDKRQTMCEKIVSLIRFSFDKDAVAGVTAKVRHFYDLYYLMQDSECADYLERDFATDLLSLIAHDKEEFDRPPMWKTSDIRTSMLFLDFNNIWQKVIPSYTSEVGALSYGEIPSPKDICEVMTVLLDKVRKIIQSSCA